jgi:release factor glutamine methyltransferase
MTATRRLVEAGTERLRAAGSETPRLDAELLLAYAIGETGEPVAYLRGMKEFHGIALTVDARALIPRPETELLVDTAIATVMTALTSGADRPGVLRVVDIGTGSGAVAIALAVALRARRVPPEDLEITAVDVSPDALELARENAVAHGVGDRLRFLAGDLLPAGARSQPLDIVLANLPYLRTAELDSLIERRLSAAYEPRLALDGGPDGLTIIGRLLDQLAWGLAEDGVALLEIGGDQGESAMAVVGERLPGWVGETLPDLAGLPRVLRLRRGAA